MVLGVDAYRAAEARTGVGRNLEYVIQGWAGREVPFDEIRVFSPELLPDLPSNGSLSLEILPAGRSGLWWQVARLRPRAKRTDVLYAYYTLPPGHNGPSVVANLGIYEGVHRFPGWRAKAHSRHYAYSARKANAVIANAESTKADLVEFYGVDPNKVEVVWPGADARFRPARDDEADALRSTVSRFFGEPADFFLFVGKLSLRRKVPELLQAFAEISRTRPGLRFLFAGPNSADLPVDDLIDELGLRESVRHVNHLDQDTLAQLYRAALAFVMPTTREGFSHPILEALGSGCPVMALRGASLGVLEYIEEHVEGGVERSVALADAPTAEGLAAAMAALADDESLRSRLAEQGVRCAAAFPTWDEHAGSVMEILGRVAAENR